MAINLNKTELKVSIDKKVQELNLSTISEIDDVYLFLSFDLMDSTKLKNNDPNWIEIIKSFYAIAISSISNINFDVWKYIGDEIVFVRKLRGFDIKHFIDNVFDAQQLISSTLSDKHKKTLKVKATTWIADVIKDTETHNQTGSVNNIVFTTQQGLLDFIGKDIDIGFRIAKNSYPMAVTLSAKLAYFLTDKRNTNLTSPSTANFIIASYQELKGVWDKRLYPIIWYSKNIKDMENKINIPYEDYIKKDELKNIKMKLTDDIDYLETVLKETGSLVEIQEFSRKCAEEIKKDSQLETVIDLNNF